MFYVKTILAEKQWWCYLMHRWEDKRGHAFLKVICPEVNIIAQVHILGLFKQF